MSYQHVVVMGNLGRDPELRTTANGQSVCNLSIATTRKWTSDGEKHEETEWHRVTLWGKTAEVAAQYLTKGKQVLIDGYLKTTKVTDKEGVERYQTGIVGTSMQFVGGARDDNRGEEEERPAARPAAKPAAKPARRPVDEDDSDIPF